MLSNKESVSLSAEGHLKIWDIDSGEVLVNNRNAINAENLSIALVNCLGDKNQHSVYEMHFGNGGTIIDNLGVISYKSPNVNGQNEDLYNPTFFKVVNADSPLNTDPNKNYMTVEHINGVNYTDLVINCVLDYTEPSATDTVFNLAGVAQSDVDNAADFNGSFVFDEIGLKSKGPGLNEGLLLTHVAFHPVQKSANRLLQIRYTVRVRVG